jgi:hypothetical protein
VRESGLGGQWTAAWTHTGITTLHQHDATSAAEAWTPVAYHAIGTSQLAGGDVYGGDLGVSGQSVATSSVRQEIDGSEALRFELATEATGVTVNLSRFFINDDGSLFAESGRLRLLDDSGAVVAETTFQASNAAGTQAVSLAWQDGFSAVELSAGAWDGTDFVFGAYDGGAPIATDAPASPTAATSWSTGSSSTSRSSASRCRRTRCKRRVNRAAPGEFPGAVGFLHRLCFF